MLSSIKTKLEDALDTVSGKTLILRKLKHCTSNEPWQVSSRELIELAEASYDWDSYTEMVDALSERLALPPKQWRVIYKSLVVIDYLLRYGHPRCLEWCKQYQQQTKIHKLQDFSYIDEHANHVSEREKGEGVKTVAYRISQWLDKPNEFQKVRAEAQRNRENYLGVDASGRQRALSVDAIDHATSEYNTPIYGMNNSYAYQPTDGPSMVQQRKYSAEELEYPRYNPPNGGLQAPQQSGPTDGRYRSNSASLPSRGNAWGIQVPAATTPPHTGALHPPLHAPLRTSPSASPQQRPIPVAPLRTNIQQSNVKTPLQQAATPNVPPKEMDLFGIMNDSKSAHATPHGNSNPKPSESAFDILGLSMQGNR